MIEDNLTEDKFDQKLIEQTKKSLKKGEPISDDLVLDSVYNAISKYEQWPNVSACLVEGFPSNIQQAKDWDKFVSLVICLFEAFLSNWYKNTRAQMSILCLIYLMKNIKTRTPIYSSILKRKKFCLRYFNFKLLNISSSLQINKLN